MKAFFIIVLLAALGGGYYYFGVKKASVDDLIGEDSVIGSAVKHTKDTISKNETPEKPKKNTVAKNESPKVTESVPAKKEAPKSELEQFIEIRYPMPTFLPLSQITKNWSAVPIHAYPETVVSSEAVPMTLMIGGQAQGSTKLPAGSPLKPIRLTGDQLTVASLANSSMQTQINVDKTNFKQSIESRYTSLVNTQKNKVLTLRANARKSLEANPERLAAMLGKGASPQSGTSFDDPKLAVVKASINRGEAHPASLDEAKTFMWNGSEQIGGEMRGTYDTVSVHFEVSTIFGKFPTDYKCLLKGGQVVGWIDPISEEKITKD